MDHCSLFTVQSSHNAAAPPRSRPPARQRSRMPVRRWRRSRERDRNAVAASRDHSVVYYSALLTRSASAIAHAVTRAPHLPATRPPDRPPSRPPRACPSAAGGGRESKTAPPSRRCAMILLNIAARCLPGAPPPSRMPQRPSPPTTGRSSARPPPRQRSRMPVRLYAWGRRGRQRLRGETLES